MGWNGSGGASAPKKAPPKKDGLAVGKGALAGVIVVSLAVLGLWLFLVRVNTVVDARQKKGGDKAEKSSRLQDVSYIARPKPVADLAQSGEAKIANASTSTDNLEQNDETPRAEPKKEKPKVRRTFESGTDELIAMAMSTPPGSQMPPLPGMSIGDSARFVESLKKPIKIFDDDSDQIKAIKQTVQNTREEIAQLMLDNPNMTFADILQEHRKIHNEDVDVRNQTATELQKIIDAGDIEGAKEFRTMMNLALQQMGIKEIDTPITEEEKAEAEAREAEEEAAAQEAEAEKGNS